MATTECPDCEKHFVGTRCICGYDVRPTAPGREGYRLFSPAGPRPCTLQQNRAAQRITQDVLDQRITAEEGRRRMVELFGMPELEHET